MEASDRGAMVPDFGREVEVEVASPSTTMSGSVSPTPSPPSEAPHTSFPSAAQAATCGAGTTAALEMNANSFTGGSEGIQGTRNRDEKVGNDRSEGSGGGMELALTPFTPVDLSGKRGRGRPRGSGKRQVLASLGEWFALSAGGNFTPHVVTIPTGEDVAARILSFSQKGPRSICILSANGSISNVTLRQPGSCGGTLTYEGRFEILSLTGSFTLSEDGSARSRTGGLSISLAGPDGRVVGGGVAGLLLAASPIQVVVGSFVPNTVKAHKRRTTAHQEIPAPTVESRPDLLANATVQPISQVAPNDHHNAIPVVQGHTNQGKVGAIDMESTNPAPFRMVGWPQEGFSLGEQRISPDINVCLQHEQ
ncbi:AT-hook motif nuclear-localized protein 1 [Rhynchospora pubera]|uniref:AT-hook motif nuclear-localized protein n=1 Tax=Rhynchospora pubera TaxID=906938 RepID=A0AAV8CCG6_9POAL|nr:AT-hook motif nuclear-localized protein 1 [Rhynchospora pubera]